MMSGNAFLPKRILVIKAAGIGDLILAVPALRALRERFPDAVIDLLATPKCSSLLKHCPYLNDIMIIRTQGPRNRIMVRDFWSIIRTIHKLRSKRYDIAINLCHLFTERGAGRMRLLMRTIGAGKTLGRNTDGLGTFYDDWIFDSWEDPSYSGLHEVDLNLDLVRHLGAEDPAEGLEFWIGEEDRKSMQKVLAGAGVSGNSSHRLVLTPGGDAVYKRWPEEHFAALGDLLIRKTGAEVILVGSTEDRPMVDRIISSMESKPVNLAGKLSLLELAALLEASDLMVTNDTGPMHLAAAVGTPVLAFFGPGRPGEPGKPGRYAPYGPDGFHVMMYRPVVCDRCIDFECKERECLTRILPDEVFVQVEQRLALKQEKYR